MLLNLFFLEQLFVFIFSLKPSCWPSTKQGLPRGPAVKRGLYTFNHRRQRSRGGPDAWPCYAPTLPSPFTAPAPVPP